MTKKVDGATKLANKQKLIVKKLEEKNKAFNKLSKIEKRIEIAKDVISQVKAEKFIAKCGIYFSTESFNEFGQEESAQQILLGDKAPKCTVCALGGITLSTIRKNNAVKIGVLQVKGGAANQRKLVADKTHNIFTKTQLDMMEIAFERQVMDRENPYFTNQDYPFNNTMIGQKAIDFGSKYADINDRLVAIMENLIANNGIFKP